MRSGNPAALAERVAMKRNRTIGSLSLRLCMAKELRRITICSAVAVDMHCLHFVEIHYGIIYKTV